MINRNLYYYRTGGYTRKYMPYLFDDMINIYEVQKKVVAKYFSNARYKKYFDMGVMLLNTYQTNLLNLISSGLDEEKIKEIIGENIQNKYILEACKNLKNSWYDKEYLAAIENKDINHLYQIGINLNRKREKHLKTIKLITKLDL